MAPKRNHEFLDRSKLKALRAFLPDELIPAPDQRGTEGFVCPRCGSGTHKGDKSTGAVSYFRGRTDGTYLWHCKSCQHTGDIYDYVSLKKNLAKGDAVRYVIQTYADKPMPEAATEGHRQEVEPTTLAKPKEQPLHDYTNYLKRHPLFSETPGYTYLENRGLTHDTIRKFKLGFDSQITYTNQHGLEFFGKAILIPFLDDEAGTIPYVTARFIDNEVPLRYKNPSISKAGELPLYHPASLYTGEPCFVTEGAFDALSILQVGGEAVALNGIGNANKLIEVLRKTPTKSKLIICLDNDSNGATEKSALELTEQLRAMGFDAIRDNSVCGQHKDPNERLVSDPAGFRTAVQAKIEALRCPKIGTSAAP